MKTVILRCEDYARGGGPVATLLDGAKTVHLQQLAQAGAAGTVSPPAPSGGRGDAVEGIDRFDLHRALCGVRPGDPGARPARCYAAQVNRSLASDEVAWCCEFVTQRDGALIDPTSGDIPTKESDVLIQALNEALGSETQQWVTGHGSHHLFIVRGLPLAAEGRPAIPSPELLVGTRWKRSLPAGEIGQALGSLIEEASKVLEEHPINRVRIDLGENPANLLWCWGSTGAEPDGAAAPRGGRPGALLSSHFPMRGFAGVLGLRWKEGPASFEERSLRSTVEDVAALLGSVDAVYVHLRVEAADPVERLCAMERIDQMLLKPLTHRLPGLGPWRALVAIDDRTRQSVPFVAIGTGLPIQPVTQLHAQTLRDSPLSFPDGHALFSWFMQERMT